MHTSMCVDMCVHVALAWEYFSTSLVHVHVRAHTHVQETLHPCIRTYLHTVKHTHTQTYSNSILLCGDQA